MKLWPKTLLTTVLLLAASSSIAQEPYHSPDPDLMARLSYDSSGAVRGDFRQICIAVSRDGEYRIVQSLGKGQTQRLHGRLAKEESRQLSKLLGSAELRDLPVNHGGLIRQEAESFKAEIPSEAWRLQWMNADGENFPPSVAKLVFWLQRFQPKDGKSFEYTEYPDVCPAGGLRLPVAENSRP